MKAIYNKKQNTMYITLKKGKYDHSKKITDNILVDVSKKGDVLGVEILDASETTEVKKSSKIPVDVISQ